MVTTNKEWIYHMATLPALVSAIALVDGRERKAIEHVARMVREAGFISTGKRGGGAAEMDFTAAVNLLIGLNGCDSPKDATAAIPIFRRLIPLWPARDDAPLETFCAIDNAITFGDAFEKLIEGVPELVLAGCQYNESAWPDDSKEQRKGRFQMMTRGDGPMRIIVTLSRYSARFRCTKLDKHGNQDTIWEMPFIVDIERFRDGPQGVGRRVEVHLTLPMLIAAWRSVVDVDHVDEPQVFAEAFHGQYTE
jgi:hypothetical protein